MKSWLIATIAATTMSSSISVPAPPSQNIVDHSFSVTVPFGDEIYGMRMEIAGASVSIVLSKSIRPLSGERTERVCL